MDNLLTKYKNSIALPVRYDSTSLGTIKDADGKPLLTKILYWGWIKDVVAANAFGNRLAEAINSEEFWRDNNG